MAIGSLRSGKPKTFKKTVTTHGTRAALSATTLLVREFVVKGLNANTGLIYLGDVTVASSNGYELAAAASASVPALYPPKEGVIYDLSAWYIDSAVDGEGVCVFYVQHDDGQL